MITRKQFAAISIRGGDGFPSIRAMANDESVVLDRDPSEPSYNCRDTPFYLSKDQALELAADIQAAYREPNA